MLTIQKSVIATSLLAVGLIAAAAPTESAAQTPVNVKVINGPTAPVPIRDMDNGRQPVDVHKVIPTAGFIYAVPAGKRLVIETITIRANLDIGDSPAYAELLTNTTDPNPGFQLDALTTGFHEILLTRQGLSLNNEAVFVGTHAVRLYSEPNTYLFFQIGHAGAGPLSGLVSFSGYLVDVQ